MTRKPPRTNARRTAAPRTKVASHGPDRADSPAIDLGRTARRLRESQNLTLADVAKRADISSAMLSRLETGRVSPSLETIVALAQSLGVTASVLMQRVGADDGGAQLIRAGEGLETVRSGTRRGHTYHLLAAQRGPRKIFEPFLVTLNDRSEVFPGFQHPGVEFIHLLTGILHYRHLQRRRGAWAGAVGEGADPDALHHHLWPRGRVRLAPTQASPSEIPLAADVR
jgi:transcriptional regulator with XRE-family HTH domain